MLSWLKAKAIQATDWINAHHDPFDDFTRPPQPKYLVPLHELAEVFENDLYENFLIEGGRIVNYRIPLPLGSPLDLGDQSLWHGIASGTEALSGRERCEMVLKGLKRQQPDGHLIRGLDLNRIQQDASNDQASGHLFGLYAMWKWGPRKLRDECSLILDQWADQILFHDHAMTNMDGDVTTYGQLVNGWKTDPLRLSLCLAIYSAAMVMTGANRYRLAYNELYSKYRALLPYPKVKLLWLDTLYDTHRAAIHLAILSDIHFGLRGEPYRDGLVRLRNMVRKQGNIWVNALCAWGLGIQHVDDRPLALKVLSEFTLEDKQYNGGRANSDDPVIKKTTWNGEWVSRQPLPRWKVSAQDFFWQRSLYAIDFRQASSPPDSRYNGLDFLAAYRLSLKTGILNECD